MTNKPNSRGSEWRKIDLHFHTPSSYDYGNKSITNQQIIDGLIAKDMSIVAITDHHTIDIERIDDLKNIANGRVTILPGIEFCAGSRGSEPIHFIGIFSEKSDIGYIWSDLNVRSSIQKQKQNGKHDNQIYCDLNDTCELIRGLGGLISIHAGQKSNTIENITNSLPVNMAQKVDIIEKIDIFEIGKVEDAKGYIDNVFPQIKKVIPMVICSDNHNILNYNLKSNCWIKADPTFEGLKQIVYEPEDRVRIQNDKPEQKPADKTIDKVQFVDSNDFTKNEILLNQNLTVIIGGKSTGKSILLKKIAQTIDSKEVEEKTKEITNPIVEDIKFKVLWKDERENHDKRKIIYIPQSYLNRLADKKNDNEIIKIIRDALEQEDVIKNIFHKVKIQQDDNQTEINKNINALLTQKQNIAKMQDNIKIIGVKSTIEEAIKRLEKEIADEKLKTSDVTDDDFARYKELLELQNILNKERIKNDNDKKILENIKKAELFKCPEYDNLSLDITNSVAKYLEQIKTKYLTEWGRDIDLEITKVIKLNTENNVKIVENNESLKPLQEKVEKAKTLHEKIKSLTAEQDRLKKIIAEELKLKAGKDNFNTLKNRIVDLHIEFFNLLVSAKADVLKQTIIKKENGLEFDVSIEFQKNSFASSFVNSYCDGRKIGNHKLNDYQFSGIDGYKTDFQEWINELLGGTFPLNSKSQLDAIKKLANNWFEFKYHITHDGDKISEMSPGKRSFVILKLLIELDNTNKCPILLDQPEDDLDNRSIFTELVKFIKEKKKERQIIITTHNPNLVVGTDAECVIVANQHGEKTKNIDNIKFNYIQGALENIHKNKGDLALDKQSIQGHVCDILEGGQDAFEKRRKKYNFDKLKNAN